MDTNQHTASTEALSFPSRRSLDRALDQQRRALWRADALVQTAEMALEAMYNSINPPERADLYCIFSTLKAAHDIAEDAIGALAIEDLQQAAMEQEDADVLPLSPEGAR